jgi:type IV secretion system protein TrbL
MTLALAGFTLPNPIKIIGGLLGGAAQSVAGSVFGELAKLVVQALNKALASMATLWINVGTPQLATTTGGQQPSPTVAYIQGHLWFLMTAAAVIGVIIGCGRMVWEQRAAPGRDVIRGLVVFVLVMSSGLAVVSLAVDAADGFSSWVISGAVANESFGSALTEIVGLTPQVTGGLGLLLVILFGFFALLASLIQIVLMVIRGGMLVLLAGVLPLTAAFTGTQAGRQWFRRAVSWLVAFILYKPAAAIVYATAIRLSTSGVFGSGGVVGVVTGLTLMIVALLALPALMRFVAPMVGVIASGGAGAMVGAGAAAASLAMPSGAVRVAGATAGRSIPGGGGSGGGRGRGPEPSGSAPTPPSDRAPAGGPSSGAGARPLADAPSRTPMPGAIPGSPAPTTASAASPVAERAGVGVAGASAASVAPSSRGSGSTVARGAVAPLNAGGGRSAPAARPGVADGAVNASAGEGQAGGVARGGAVVAHLAGGAEDAVGGPLSHEREPSGSQGDR